MSILKRNYFISFKQLYTYIRLIVEITNSKLKNYLATFRSSIIILSFINQRLKCNSTIIIFDKA